MIVVFLIIEIGPFFFVLDWSFMEIFILKESFPYSLTEPLNSQTPYAINQSEYSR